LRKKPRLSDYSYCDLPLPLLAIIAAAAAATSVTLPAWPARSRTPFRER
jgi:hypothetical protein